MTIVCARICGPYVVMLISHIYCAIAIHLFHEGPCIKFSVFVEVKMHIDYLRSTWRERLLILNSKICHGDIKCLRKVGWINLNNDILFVENITKS